MLKIICVGMYIIVQDGGCYGFCQLGISYCGVLDMFVLCIVNLLVGNDVNVFVLEITFGQLIVEFEIDGWFVLMGVGCEVWLDDNVVWIGW